MASFADLLLFELDTSHQAVVEIPSDWMQGRTAFGGLLAAMATRAMGQRIPAGRDLLGLDVAFIAPAGPGPVTIEVQSLREGRFVSQASAEIRFEGSTATRVHGIFGTRRDSRLVVPAAPAVPSKPRDRGLRLPFLPGITPEFTQHFEFHFTEGGLPFSGASEPVIGGFFRHLTEASGMEAVVALVDAWPAPLLPVASGPVPASSIHWSTHIVSPPPQDFDGYWWHRAHVVQANGGYGSIVARLYADKTLIAWSEQLVAVYG